MLERMIFNELHEIDEGTPEGAELFAKMGVIVDLLMDIRPVKRSLAEFYAQEVEAMDVGEWEEMRGQLEGLRSVYERQQELLTIELGIAQRRLKLLLERALSAGAAKKVNR